MIVLIGLIITTIIDSISAITFFLLGFGTAYLIWGMP